MREENPSPKKNNLLNQKWFLPAVYLACVALIMIGAVWYQNGKENSATPKKQGAESQSDKHFPAIEVNKPIENFTMPILDSENVVIKGQFYDINGDDQAQEAALVKYGDTYQPNTGIDYALKDNSSFDVLSAMSGTVTRVQTDALLGNIIEIEHEKGLVTQYSSVKDIQVKAGDKVMQGTVLAKAGNSEINKDAAVHVHFEMRKDGVAVNPTTFIKKPLSALKSFDTEKDSTVTHKEVDEKKSTDQAEDNTSTEQSGTSDQANDTDQESSGSSGSDVHVDE